MPITSQTSTFTPDPVREKAHATHAEQAADPVDGGQAWHPAESR
jgi:hypothetical protein